MKNREIGHIISKGGNVEDIRKVIPKFPANPTKETFIKLGYAESTARRYISLLNQNNSNKAPEKTQSCVKAQTHNLMDLVQSANANYDNILVDTCALTSEQGRNVIDNAKQVTFIFATLEEMDKKKKDGSKFLTESIKEYTSKILSFPDKYMLSRFSGYSNEKYVDNILLQYMQILPKQIRPTLLTADRNLAAKAAAFELDYIFVKQSEQNQETKNEEKQEIKKEAAIVKKKLGNGMILSERNDELYIFYKGTFKFEIHRDGKKIPGASNLEIKVEHGDSIHLYEKVKSKITEQIIEID